MIAQCCCGFTELAEEEIIDHMLYVFDPADRTGNDSLEHEERDRLLCACGFTAITPDSLDAHFLIVFTPADRIGIDGKKHEVVTVDDA